ncbi:hypothetical protein NE865_13328 [Phthorimaea operculella]|nr:hypothetical protein NE865_13328 [Phthorimaea operculella]
MIQCSNDGSGSSWVSSVESSHAAMTHASLHTNSNASFVVEDEHLDAGVTETYSGEWKNDKRTGFGVSERSDGLRYEGEWFANRKYGYGVTTLRDGTREEGKYKNNVLITSQKRKHMFLMRSAKFRERVDSAVNAAQRASKIALQKADIAVSRSATAKGKAEQADEAADQAKEDCDIAQTTAKQFAPDFKHPGFDRIGLREKYRQQRAYEQQQVMAPQSQESEKILDGKSIPNHIPPMHSQLPQNNIPNQMPSRRPSTQYPKTVQSIDPRLANSTNYSSDERSLGPSYDSYYSPNQGHQSWAQQNTQPQPTVQPQNEQFGMYPPSAPQQTLNRQPTLPHQQSIDQSSQQFSNQGRRLSASVRPSMNQQPAPQVWNAPQRRQSVLAQPQPGPQDQMYVDGGTAAYGRNELRTGTVASEGALANQMMADPYRQTTDAQGYRQNVDPQGYRQDQQMYRQGPPDQQAYRQQPDQQGYRQQQPPVDQDMNRQPASRPNIDYFDHYKRPPSRDGSVDRYGRRSRQPSVEAAAPPPSGGSRAGSVAPQPPMASSRPASRAATPAAGNGHLASGRGSISRAGSREPPPFEESIMRKRNLGQDIAPSPYQPKRTESLYVAQAPAPPPPIARGGGGGGGGGRKLGIQMMWYQGEDEEDEDLLCSPAILARRASESWINVPPAEQILTTQQTLQRKKSLPDVAGMPRMVDGAGMSREEVSMLGSARREEVRRQIDETEKLRANPLLYLVSPQVKVSMLGSARREEVRRQIDETEKLRAIPLLYLVSPQVKVSVSKQLFIIHDRRSPHVARTSLYAGVGAPRDRETQRKPPALHSQSASEGQCLSTTVYSFMVDGAGMSREEVSMLGSARREEVRRQIDETEKLRANPLLYLVSPQVKVSVSQQLFIHSWWTAPACRAKRSQCWGRRAARKCVARSTRQRNSEPTPCST